MPLKETLPAPLKGGRRFGRGMSPPFKGGWRGLYANMGAMHEVTPIVAPKAVKMLMMVWIMNFQVSFFVIVVE